MPSAKDFVIAKLSVKDRILTQDQLQQCYKTQEQTRQPLSEIIVGRGLCERGRMAQLDHACTEAMKAGRVMSCPKCGLKYFASQWSASQVYPCPKCQARMEPLADLSVSQAEVQAGDERLVSTLKLKIADQRASEARNTAVRMVQKARDSGRLSLRPKARVDERAIPHEIGKPFGDYLLQEKLGAGGSAIVFRAVDTRNKSTVALKVIKAMDATRGDIQEYAKRFDREARRLRALQHPGLAKVFDHGKYGDNLFLAMNFIEGTSLEQLIAAENSEETRTKFSTQWDRNENLVLILRDVLIALQYAHERGVVHGDIKPSNMFMDAGGRCYLTDFGVARDVEKEVAEALEGKSDRDLSYLSPEQAGRSGSPPIDARSDIFSVGTMLYEVLTLRRPFAGETPKETIEALRSRHPRDPKTIDRGIPDALCAICLKALEKHPTDRYAGAGAFADDLTRYVAGEPVEAAQSSGGKRLSRLIQRDARVKITVVLCAVWLGVSLVGALLIPGFVRGVSQSAADSKAKVAQGDAATRRTAADPFLRTAQATIQRMTEASQPDGFLNALRDARRAAQEAIGQDPASSEGHMFEGTLLRIEGRFDEALQSLSKAVQHGPTNGRAWLERGRCYLELHRHWPLENRYARSGDMALRDFRKALEHATRPQDQAMASALIAVLNSNQAEAIAQFQKAVDVQPDFSDAYLERGRLRVTLVQPEAAMPDFDLALSHVPGNVFAHIGRGQALLLDNKPKEALEAFERALAFGPVTYPWARLGAGVARLALGDTDQAMTAFEALVEKCPRFPEAWANRATAHVRKGDLQSALKDYDKAIDLDPDYVEALANRGHAWIILGEPNKARNDFIQFQTKGPNHPFRYQVERWMKSLE